MYLDCGVREWSGNGTVCGEGEREGALVREGRGGEGRERAPHCPPVTASDIVPNAAKTTAVIDDNAVPHGALVVHPAAELGRIPVLSGVLAGGVTSSIVPQEHRLAVRCRQGIVSPCSNLQATNSCLTL